MNLKQHYYGAAFIYIIGNSSSYVRFSKGELYNTLYIHKSFVTGIDLRKDKKGNGNMRNNKKWIVLIGISLLIIIFVLLYMFILSNKNKVVINEYVTVNDCVNSINALYGEKILDVNDIGNKSTYVKYDEVKLIIKKIGLEDEIGGEIKVIVGKRNISREKWLQVLKYICDKNGMKDICEEKEISVFSVNDNNVITTNKTYMYTGSNEKLINKKITAYVRDNIIVFVKESNNNVEFDNVLIKSSEEDNVIISSNGIEKKINVKGLNEELSGIMADVILKDDKVDTLKLKRDSISGKVVAIGDKYIEIEGFGKVDLVENYKIYCSYDSFIEKDINSILVGEENLRFIVADKKICGIFIDEVPSADTIRVLLKTTSYKDILHDIVTVSSKSKYNLIYYENDENGNVNEKKQTYNEGETVTFDVNNEILKKGRVKIVSNDENGKIIITSISRNGNSPEYRGNIELSLNSGKIAVVNELSLEEYLYAVVPSEMPSSYGVEALKVQAVCARSYAVSHMNNDKLSSYGAQVDDSTDYQVYNSTPENENSISAVKATYGEVLMCGEDIANTYFFATSCGSTTDSTIWGGTSLPYIQGKILSDKNIDLDLTNNKQFSEFIKKDYETYDSGNPWYRWNISISNKDLSNIVNNNLSKIYGMYPQYVLTLKDDKYLSENINSVGEIDEIYVEKRGVGGTIEELIIKGNSATVKIIKQSAIRNLFNVNGITINKNDGTSVDTFTSLPSAFFAIENNNNEFTFYGGGYGHGAGMSQTAVKKMIEEKMNYKEILKFFYSDVELMISYEK